MIAALITRDVLASLLIGNFLATYTLEVARFATVMTEPFLLNNIVGLKVVRIRRISKAIITVRIV